MGNIAQNDWVWFVIGLGGTVIVSQSGLVFWLFVQRVRTKERESETLERRLSNGAETMQRMIVRLEHIEGKQALQEAKGISSEKFDNYCNLHNNEHKEINKIIVSTKESIIELKECINLIGQRVEDAVKSIPRTLGKIIEVKNFE